MKPDMEDTLKTERESKNAVDKFKLAKVKKKNFDSLRTAKRNINSFDFSGNNFLFFEN